MTTRSETPEEKAKTALLDALPPFRRGATTLAGILPIVQAALDEARAAGEAAGFEEAIEAMESGIHLNGRISAALDRAEKIGETSMLEKMPCGHPRACEGRPAADFTSEPDPSGTRAECSACAEIASLRERLEKAERAATLELRRADLLEKALVNREGVRNRK